MRLIDFKGLKAHPTSVISTEAYFYGNGSVIVGEGSRIDHGCILTGRVRIGRKTHIPPYCILYGKAGITIGDLVNFGVYTVLHSESESFTGEWLMGPLVPEESRRPDRRPIVVQDRATLCTRTTVLPGVTIGKGSVVGAHSLVRLSVPPMEKWAGTPARFIDRMEESCLAA